MAVAWAWEETSRWLQALGATPEPREHWGAFQRPWPGRPELGRECLAGGSRATVSVQFRCCSRRPVAGGGGGGTRR